LIETAAHLDALRERTGKTIRLGIEPEPLCLLETTDETIAFFRRLFARAGDAGRADAVRTHVGVCYDVCHQAVEFEDAAGAVAAIDAAEIRINKVHISCALQLDRPAQNEEGRVALRRFVEPRYLHQTTAVAPTGEVLRAVDLDQALLDAPPPGFKEAAVWRVHFHVPVDAERIGPLATTRSSLRDALRAVARLSYAPHLEVETYTWDVMPGRQKVNLADALASEMNAARAMLKEIQT
jgi:hypothetical protein